MTNTWIVATIVAVIAGVVGFFVVLRGSAFPAHAIPNGAFAGAAGANLFGFNALLGLAVFAVARRASGSAPSAGAAATTSSTALALVMMLALGAVFLSRSTEYEPQIYSLLFGEVLGVSTTELLPVAVLAVAVHRRLARPLPAAPALLGRPRDRRSPRRPHATAWRWPSSSSSPSPPP